MALAAGGLALIVSLAAAPVDQRAWRRVDSPNLVVAGDIGERQLLDITIRFEGFRQTLGRVLPGSVLSSAVPTVVIVFPNDRAFTPLKPVFEGRRVDAAGLFAPGSDINYIVIVDSSRPERMRVVFHEYAHLMIANLGRELPAWLSEGLAEFYSTFEVSRGGREVTLGVPLDDHLFLLNDRPPLTLEELLRVDHDSPLYNEGTRRSVFYAQAWALTHFIMLGQPARTRQLGEYVDSLSRGVPALEAWQQAFGAEDMSGELLRYIRSQAFRAFKYTFSDELGSFEAPVTSMPPADGQALLAGFLIQQRRLDDAEERLAEATRLGPDGPRLRIERAALEIARRRPGNARQHLDGFRAPDDWLTAYLAGAVAADLAESGNGWVSPLDVEAAGRLFEAAREGHAEFPNALARMAALEARTLAGPTPGTRAAIERARSLAPGRHEYALVHAQVLARLREFDAARSVLGPLMGSLYPAPVQEAARRMMETVVELQNAAPRHDARGAGATRQASESEPAGGSARGGFREVQPGEQRLEGMLERIECLAGGAGLLHVRSGDATVTVSVPALSDVVLIAYREDVRGTVGCGPLAEPLAAYVTWRPADDGSGRKIAVAVEILPKR